LYPPGWILVREAVKEFALDGTVYPAQSIFLVCVLTVHRSPALYPEPEQFRPGRWAGEKTELARGAYLPFSIGPRSCVGERLGRMIARETLGAVVGRYHLVSSANTQGPWLPRITFAPRE